MVGFVLCARYCETLSTLLTHIHTLTHIHLRSKCRNGKCKRTVLSNTKSWVTHTKLKRASECVCVCVSSNKHLKLPKILMIQFSYIWFNVWICYGYHSRRHIVSFCRLWYHCRCHFKVGALTHTHILFFLGIHMRYSVMILRGISHKIYMSYTIT